MAVRSRGPDCQEKNPLCREQELAAAPKGGPKLSVEAVRSFVARSGEAWAVYRSQAVFPAAVALALLYLSVLSFVRPAQPMPHRAAASLAVLC